MPPVGGGTEGSMAVLAVTALYVMIFVWVSWMVLTV
jgi:hypothetical protein